MGMSNTKREIVVRRSVFAAAQELMSVAETAGHNPCSLAEKEIQSCSESNDEVGQKFWRAVWTHLVLDFP